MLGFADNGSAADEIVQSPFVFSKQPDKKSDQGNKREKITDKTEG
jgi:hypothetical protein